MRLQGLPPVIDAWTRCLILGSFPGERSLATQPYYGHPTNQFLAAAQLRAGRAAGALALP